jgi:hypothetical protein
MKGDPMAKAAKAIISLYFCNPCLLSTEEFEQMENDIKAHIAANDVRVGDRVLAQLTLEHHGRYLEALEINARRAALARSKSRRIRCFNCKQLIPVSEARLVLMNGTKKWSCDGCWDERLRS